MKKIIIAVDGHSSCGKSTLAKRLASKLGYAYIDTGAMYRAVTLYFIQNEVDLKNGESVASALNKCRIRFKNIKDSNHTFLNDTDVEEEIRKMYVSEMVSPVATISIVRRAMVQQQQEMGSEKGIVMDGRDIGTVVFPNAELKIFLTAKEDVRAQRRFMEITNKGQEVSFEEVKNNLLHRDHIDSTREDSPLKQAEDAVVIDNSSLTPEGTAKKALAIALKVITGFQNKN